MTVAAHLRQPHHDIADEPCSQSSLFVHSASTPARGRRERDRQRRSPSLRASSVERLRGEQHITRASQLLTTWTALQSCHPTTSSRQNLSCSAASARPLCNQTQTFPAATPTVLNAPGVMRCRGGVRGRSTGAQRQGRSGSRRAPRPSSATVFPNTRPARRALASASAPFVVLAVLASPAAARAGRAL